MPLDPSVLMKIDPAGTFRRAEAEKMQNKQLGEYLLQQKMQTENMQRNQQDLQAFQEQVKSGGPTQDPDQMLQRLSNAAISVGNPDILQHVGQLVTTRMNQMSLQMERQERTHKLQRDSLGSALQAVATQVEDNPDMKPEVWRQLYKGPLDEALQSGAIDQTTHDIAMNAQDPQVLRGLATRFIPALGQIQERRRREQFDSRMDLNKDKLDVMRKNVDSAAEARKNLIDIRRGQLGLSREKAYAGTDQEAPRLPSAGGPAPATALDQPATPARPQDMTPQERLSNLPPEKLANAAEWVQTGKPPSRLGPIAAAETQKNGGDLLKVAGIDPTQVPLLRASSAKQLNALTQLAKNKAAVEAFSTTANLNADLLRKASAELDRTDIPLVNRAIVSGQAEILGNPKATRFLILARSVQNEYARLITQPNLTGQLTDTARREMEEIVKKSLTHDQLIMALDTLKQEGGSRLAGVNKELDALKSEIGIIKPGVAGPGAKPDTVSETKVVNGKTYVKQNGKWFEQ